MVMTCAQEYAIAGKNDISDMTYVSDDRLLCPLMIEHPITCDPYSTVVFIDPSNTSNYSANLVFDKDYYYPRIDCIDYQYSNCKHILLGGLNTWFLKKASIPGSANYCNERGTINVKIIQTIQNTNTIDQMNTIENVVDWISPSNIIAHSQNLDNVCNDI